MTQALVIRKINSLKNSFLAKWFGTAFLFFLTMCSFPSVAQSVTSGAISISKIDVINETFSGAIDGKIQIAISDLNAAPSHYRISYDFLAEGNKFVSEELTAVKGVLTLKNAKIGNYYNLRVIRTADNKSSEITLPVSLKNSNVAASNGFQDPTPTNVTCSTIGYTDCAGTARSITNAESGKGYSSFSDWRPCGFEITSSCTITQIGRWHCIDGNLSTPPASNKYNIVDYTGVGLTALQACRLNWIVCNYAYNAVDVANAIWYICGTGGVNNTIAQAAVAAVPSPNGTESLIKFYKSLNSVYQDAIKWECKTVPCSGGRVTGLYFNELNGGTDLAITNGASFTVNQLGLLYNLEASTTGTIGSVKFTISGPSATSNIENFSPYNSPATGGGAWTGAAGTYTVNLKTYSDAGGAGNLCHDTTITFYVTNADCGCVTSASNLLVNPSFESGTTGWSWSGGSLTTGTGYVTCGAANGFNNWSTGTSKVWQDVNMTPGSTVTFKGYAGTHTAGISCSPTLSLIFLNSSNTVLGQSNATVTRDVDVNNSLLELYTITAVAPAGTTKVRVQSSINCNTMKIDAFCLTVSSPAPCTGGRVTGLYFNELNGGTDLPITNGSSFTVNQLGLLYNLEASTTGTIGSIKYTITGPTASSNIENAAPYNSPNTGSGAWSGAIGTYSVNLKTYSQSGAGGNLCHDTTITFNVTGPDCSCVTSSSNLLVNPSFENGTTGWSWSGGSLTTGTGYVTCGAANGFNNWGSGTSKVWQDVNMTPGSTVTFKGYAGTHTPGISCSPMLSLIFLNSSNVVLAQSNVTVTRDVDVNNSLLELYTITAVAPAGTAKVRVQNSITCNTLKIDAFCLTATPGCNINAGTDGSTTVCDNSTSAINLFNIITGEQTGGTWSRLTGTGGTFIAASGTFTPAAGATTSTFRYVVTGTTLCANDTSIATVVINPQANAGSDGSTTVCDTLATAVNLYNLISGEQTGGTWSRLTGTGGTFNAAAGTFLPAVGATNSSFIYVKAGTAPCPNDTSVATVTIQSCQLLTLGNRVWYDANNNGLNDAAENGIRNVAVKLYADANNDNVADGAAIATTTTDVNGNYSFTNLVPGNYIVGVVLPNGYMSSSVNGGDPDNNTDLDDNGQVLSGNEVRGLAITLASGTEPGGSTNNTYDFGLLPDCSCPNSASNLLVNPSFENGTTGWSWSGGSLTTGTGYIACGAANGFNNWGSGTAKVWQDVTNIAVGSTVDFKAFAGTHTPGISCSPKLSLIFLNASDVVISQSDVTVTRDVDINYSQLEQYSISAVVPAGTVKVRVQSSITCNTMKMDAFCLVVTAVPLGSIGDRVWNDTDGDGIQDPGEVGVAGITLVLLNSAGQPIATTTTDAFGNYKFSGLPAGNYSVRVTPPSNYTLSAKTQGPDTSLDSDFDPITYTTGTVTLAAGQNRTDIDAGLKFTQPSTASVGDRVWFDANANGNQDAGEPGVSNVLVTLYNSSNVAVRSTYTDVNGNYLFTDVTPGSYTVGVSLPPAFVFTTNSGAVSGATNSDIVPATGRTASFTVNAGDQITYVDAGIKTQVSTNGSVGDYVWNDINKNGFQEPGEPGIAGVMVRLFNATTNALVATTFTDINGGYIFNDLPAGNYQVDFITPAGYTVTTKLNSNVTASGVDSDVDPVTSKSAVFALATGQRITTVDAGYWLTTPPGTGKIGDRVWLDANQNGIQDATEASVQGVTVTLYDAANTAIKMAVTDANGNYLFTDLAAGNYTVGFSNLPAGYTFTTQGLGTAATGSDANPATGRTAIIALAAGQTNLDVDAGIRSSMAGTGSIGNRVWVDLNNNGLQDAIEPGIQGVTVELLDAAGNPIDKDPNTAGVQPTTTITNALGEYLFTGLAAGDYKVRFSTLPAGYNASPKAAGTNRDIDSDGNPIAAGTSTTDVVSLAAGEDRLDIDFGLFNPTAPLGQIGDFVWFDSNNNGVQDPTEQGVPGVTVSLINAANAVIATTVTDGNGNYRFVNVADGSYTVKFSNLPAGFTFSPKDAGADNADSDADPATGITGIYTISGGNTNLTVDAGIYSTRAALGDYVWFDANSNGTQEATEKGIPGITVTLYNAANVAVTSAVTDQNGRYFFSNLTAGTYTVGFGTTPGKLVFTAKDVVSAGDAADSDVDPATGKTGSYTLAAGQVNLTVDAGLKPLVPATVGDYVWFDLNRDGIQDADEPGVPGVLVTLYNAANQPVGSAVTDGNGYYLISNVPAGNGYYTVFSNTPDPAAPFTLQNVGGAAATDNSKADATGKSTPFNVADGENVSNIDAGIYRLINIHGNVWNDANGLTDLQINRTGVQAIPNSLNIYLVDVATNQIVQAESINNDGTYNFFNVNVNTSYVIVLSTIVAFPGRTSPIPFLPSGWQRVGENLGAGPLSGSDGVPNGLLFIDTETSDIFDANFGIRVSSGEVIVG